MCGVRREVADSATSALEGKESGGARDGVGEEAASAASKDDACLAGGRRLRRDRRAGNGYGGALTMD